MDLNYLLPVAEECHDEHEGEDGKERSHDVADVAVPRSFVLFAVVHFANQCLVVGVCVVVVILIEVI